MPNNVILVNGKKFMWDGVDHPSKEETSEAMKRYEANGFEVEMVEEGEKTYLYTRRVVEQTAGTNA